MTIPQEGESENRRVYIGDLNGGPGWTLNHRPRPYLEGDRRNTFAVITGSADAASNNITSTESRLFGKVLLQDDTREQGRHFSGIQLRVDSKPSHSVYECSSADTPSDCSAICTAYAALACGKRLYDFLALLPFVLLSAGVDIRS